MAHTAVDQQAGTVQRYTTLLHAFLFVAGFSLVFIVGWGGAATILGQLFAEYRLLLTRVGGVIVILFGLFTLGLLNVSWLNYDTRPDWQPGGSSRLGSSFLMGLFFAAGWTPCVGPTLGTILALGISQETAGQGMILASGYALGLGLPFLLIGFGMQRAVRALRRLRPYIRAIEISSGLLMILIGLLLVTDRITAIALWAQQNGFYLDLPLGGTATPSYFVAVLAGLLSFLSPCVLPLVPAYIGYLSGQAVTSGPGENRVNSGV